MNKPLNIHLPINHSINNFIEMNTFKSELFSAMKHVDSMTLDDCNEALNLLNICIEQVQRARIKCHCIKLEPQIKPEPEEFSFPEQNNDLQLVKSPNSDASDTFADFETSENDNTYSEIVSKSKRKEKHFSSANLDNKIRKRKSGKNHKKANLTKTVTKLLDKFSLNETCQKTKPANFCCVICGDNFVDHLLLYDHLDKHEGTKISCNLCKKIFENMFIFKYHTDDEKCTFISTGIKGEAFGKPSSEDCLQIMKFRYCPFCGESSTTKFNLRRHITSRKCCPKITNTLHCIHCKFLTFQSPDEVAEHMQIHAHTCDACNLTLPTVRALKKHRVTECLGAKKDKKPHFCKECPEVFRNRKSLRIHMKLHPKPKKAKEIHKCDECHYSSHNISRVKRHKRTVHTSDAESRTLVCDQCPSMFKDLKNLKDHIIYLHTDTFCYICNICGKSYKMKSLLTRHMLFHFNKRRHNCSLCPQKFFRSAHLKRHLLSKHKKKTPVNKKLATLPAPSIPVETTAISNMNLNTPMEQSQVNSAQMLSLLHMQSGKMLTMSAIDYIYGLVLKNSTPIKNENLPLNTTPELPAMWNQIDVYSVDPSLVDQGTSTSQCTYIQMPNMGGEGPKANYLSINDRQPKLEMNNLPDLDMIGMKNAYFSDDSMAALNSFDNSSAQITSPANIVSMASDVIMQQGSMDGSGMNVSK